MCLSGISPHKLIALALGATEKNCVSFPSNNSLFFSHAEWRHRYVLSKVKSPQAYNFEIRLVWTVKSGWNSRGFCKQFLVGSNRWSHVVQTKSWGFMSHSTAGVIFGKGPQHLPLVCSRDSLWLDAKFANPLGHWGPTEVEILENVITFSGLKTNFCLVLKIHESTSGSIFQN